jgi:hypothetical protein
VRRLQLLHNQARKDSEFDKQRAAATREVLKQRQRQGEDTVDLEINLDHNYDNRKLLQRAWLKKETSVNKELLRWWDLLATHTGGSKAKNAVTQVGEHL